MLERCPGDVSRIQVDELEKRFIDILAHEQKEAKTKKVCSDDVKLQTKNDDATAQVDRWNEQVCTNLGIEYHQKTHGAALDRLRELQMLWYKSFKGGIILSFRRYMVLEYGSDWLVARLQSLKRLKRTTRQEIEKELEQDYMVEIDAIRRASGASFWEWEDGSAIFFWRWTREHRKELRDGLRVWFRRLELPRYWGRQRWPQDKLQSEKLKDKVTKVVN